ncbi:endoglucanase II [Pterulicium gracile]|uniref:AA9 family lytic polysaccharide monooxygenase n=1 Tax=Pterulicium gracile TaxID=1884261 RepID=A0A5C3QRN9_9AGAR|nr:endoglucanase II [Pterula gracilis]
MKFSSALVFSACTSVAFGHTIFQKVSVNGQDQGQLKGVRATNSNNPITNLNDGGMACNNNLQYKDNNIINIPAGARVGAWWGHVIGGPQGSNDPDHPIAASHKGPTMFYMAKVDNAASTGTSGLKWFKVAEEGLSGSKWGVDTMIANGGWQYFNMPMCVASGNYLLRVEILALHSAYSAGGAQVYVGCAQINVTGGGSSTPSNTVSFPGAYKSSDPGITLNIYSGTLPNNGGKPYTIPGPAVSTFPSSCSGSSQPPSNTSQTPSQPSSGAGAALYAQCGGTGWTGPTTCVEGTCKASNEYYSQCLP